MSAVDATLLAALIGVGAALSAAVGPGGASSYVAALALLGIAPPAIRASALVLNLLVAGLALARFAAARSVAWRSLAPFVVTSVPFAWVGGAITLPGRVHAWLLGGALLAAAALLLARPPASEGSPLRTLPSGAALGIGGVLGLLSGLTGVGGGIFLSPLLVLGRFSQPRTAGGLAAGFIWLNSAAALLARPDTARTLPAALPVWAAAALAGGALGAGFGSARATPRTLRRLLAAVLTVAALKMLLV
jgi:uncharacterized membrane protein YfcA